MFKAAEYAEEDLLPLSGVEHLIFCPRQAALMYVENLWEENRFTVEGNILHERTDEPATEVRGDVRIARALRVRSLLLGLVGICDVVEFHRIENPNADEGASLPGVSGRWQPYPIEYKRGIRRHELSYRVQLCAQAICLEEMLDVNIPRGALFFGKTNRRLEVIFDDELRDHTNRAARDFHALVASGKTPKVPYSAKCKSCSLLDICFPKLTGPEKQVRRYVEKILCDEESR